MKELHQKTPNDVLQNLICQTVRSMCEISLPKDANISIKGLIGITINLQEVILVDIKELINCPRQACKSQNLTNICRPDRQEYRASKKRTKLVHSENNSESGGQSDHEMAVNPKYNAKSTSNVKQNCNQPANLVRSGISDDHDIIVVDADCSNIKQEITFDQRERLVHKQYQGLVPQSENTIPEHNAVDDFKFGDSNSFTDIQYSFENFAAFPAPNICASISNTKPNAISIDEPLKMNVLHLEQIYTEKPSDSSSMPTCSVSNTTANPSCISLYTGRSSSVQCSMCFTVLQHDRAVFEKHCAEQHPGHDATPLSCAEGFGCQYCSQKFAFHSYLKRHITIHTKEKKFPCNICGVRFTRNFKRTTHMATVHANIEKTPITDLNISV